MAYRDDTGDPYIDPETGVLRNLANLGKTAILHDYEAEMSIMRQIELAADPLASGFDFTHLREIHRYLFQDVYAWAGELRTVDISKGTSRFGSHLHVENFLTKLFEQLAEERKIWNRSLGTMHLAERFAHYMGEINAAHPFREGNGRAQRFFIGQLADEHGFEIRWDCMTAQQILAASISSFDGDNRPLKELIAKHLIQKPQ